MKTICLVMIVRNEAAVIRRCLESVKPLIEHWVICDTGSTDDTPEAIRQTLSGIPGTMHQVPWVDFGHNRTEALKLARGKADYHLLIGDEEVWYSLYQVARLQHRLGLAWALVLDAYLRAYEFRPTRVEPIYQIARFYREHGRYHLAHLFSRAVIDTPYPEDLLFIEKNIYQHELRLEYALCSPH